MKKSSSVLAVGGFAFVIENLLERRVGLGSPNKWSTPKRDGINELAAGELNDVGFG
jgi:hypothetical protein